MLKQARQTLQLEAEAILALVDRLDDRFTLAVERILDCKGRVVVTGMGKSGLIGQKLAATLASTGTPAFFLHPAEGSHGDVGMVTRQDVVLALSNSGETWEVISLLPVIKRLGATLIGFVGRIDSTLARMSDVVLDVSVQREACPLGLAPTCSTTAALAMGDALAVALLEARGFGTDEFALLHPGGSLGKKLLLRVRDRMHGRERVPMVPEGHPVRDAMLEMTDKRFGMTGVKDGSGRLIGIITDGDLRRWLERDERLLSRRSGQIMTAAPKTIAADALAVEAVRKMEDNKITSLFVVEGALVERPLVDGTPVEGIGRVVGVIHLHDLLEAGLM